MSEWALPQSPEGWRVEAMTAVGCRRAIARRLGVTFIIVGNSRDGWTITKMHRGQSLGTRHYRRLPVAWRDTVGDATGQKAA